MCDIHFFNFRIFRFLSFSRKLGFVGYYIMTVDTTSDERAGRVQCATVTAASITTTERCAVQQSAVRDVTQWKAHRQVLVLNELAQPTTKTTSKKSSCTTKVVIPRRYPNVATVVHGSETDWQSLTPLQTCIRTHRLRWAYMQGVDGNWSLS